MISKTSLLTIKALVELSTLPADKTVGVGHIAQKIQAPQNYLGKVLQRLAKTGVLFSKKGLNGGFRLSKSAAEIKLYDIVRSLEDMRQREGCFMGGDCSGTGACCAHGGWDKVRSAYIDFLKSTTIADLRT